MKNMEALSSAAGSIRCASEKLCVALEIASTTETLILVDLIEKIARQERRLITLMSSIVFDERGKP